MAIIKVNGDIRNPAGLSDGNWCLQPTTGMMVTLPPKGAPAAVRRQYGNIK